MLEATKQNLLLSLDRLFQSNPQTFQADWNSAWQAYQKAKSDTEPTLESARVSLWTSSDNPDENTRCPLCTQLANCIHYLLHSGLAYSLMFLHTNTRILGDVDGWVDMPKCAPRRILRAKNYSLLKHWKLIERREKTSTRDKKRVKTVGHWRITEFGHEFAAGQVAVDKAAVVFDNRVVRFCGGPWSIQDALSTDFDWVRLTQGPWDWNT